MLAGIKRFTQKTTTITLILLLLLVVPGILLALFIRTGLVSWVDTLYASPVFPALFWVLLVITRGAFVGGWIGIGSWLVNEGERRDFFWFKPQSTWQRERLEREAREAKESVDKSSDIFMWIAIPFIAFVVSEFLLRLFSSTFPPYLPPPNN